MANVNLPHHMKDSRWLQLEVCREAQRSKCTRSDEECKFAHPPSHVEVQNGRVVACYDSIKGRCNRENPPCKYYHPPQHLKDQLLINGRNHLAMKNILVQQMQMQMPQLQMQPQLGLMNPYYQGAQFSAAGSPYMNPNPTFLSSAPSPGPSTSGLGSSQGESSSASPSMSPMLLQHQMQAHAAAGKNRMDRLEVCREFSRGACRRTELECRYAHPADHVPVTDNMVVVCMDSLKGKCSREACRYFHPPAHLVQQLKSRQSVNAPASTSSTTAAAAAAVYAANAAMGVNVYAAPAVNAASAFNGGMTMVTPTSMAAAAVVSPSASSVASSAYEVALNQQLQAAFASSPLFAAAAMLNQKQAVAAMLAAAAQQAQVQAAQAASSVYAAQAAQAHNAAAYGASVGPSATAATALMLSQSWPDPSVQGLKRKASTEQDNDLVFHGLQAPVKRQTMSPSALSGPSLALYQQHQSYQQQQHQQSMAAMYGLAPLMNSFQHNLSMHASPYANMQIPGLPPGQYEPNPGGSSGAEVQEVPPEPESATSDNPPEGSS